MLRTDLSCVSVLLTDTNTVQIPPNHPFSPSPKNVRSLAPNLQLITLLDALFSN